MCKTAYPLKALQVREAIARQTYRARHKLARRQVARCGAALRSPKALDVEVSGMPAESGY